METTLTRQPKVDHILNDVEDSGFWRFDSELIVDQRIAHPLNCPSLSYYSVRIRSEQLFHDSNDEGSCVILL